MANEVTVTVLVDVKPEIVEKFWNEILPGLLADTRVFEGVLSARAVRQVGPSNKILFIDVFRSAKAADDYFDWRRQRGDLDTLLSMVSVPPEISMWPLSTE